MADSRNPSTNGDGITLWPIILGVFVLALFLIFGSSALFEVPFLNIEEIFRRILNGAGPVASTIFSASTWNLIGTISALFSLFFLIIIIFSIVRIREIQINDKHFIEDMINQTNAKNQAIESKVNSRWNHVLSLVVSENESEWRLAIIEADSILDDFLKKKGYFGQTMADRLKSAKEGDAFVTADNAFEAHGIRNKIAHEGINFSLSQMETRRIMRLYESVFEELGII